MSNELKFKFAANGRDLVLLEEFEVALRGAMIRVPSGFVSDGASVPRMFWSFFPPFGLYTEAAVVHDYLYCTHLVSRSKADDIFIKHMQKLGVGWWRRHIMYWAVRLRGGSSWRKSGEKWQKENAQTT